MTKTKIGVTKGKRSTHNLSCQSITTSNVFKTQPIFSREVFKGDSFNIELSNINRVDQLPVSSFVRLKNNFDWFYVKMTQIWKPFDAFMTKAPYAFNFQNTIPTHVPYFTTYDLMLFMFGSPDATNIANMLSDQLYSGIYTVDLSTSFVINCTDSDAQNEFANLVNAHSYDFVFITTVSGVDKIYCIRLSDAGIKMFSLLYSLGYRIPKYIVDVADDSSYSFVKNNVGSVGMSQSALPLMAYLSVYVNYFIPTKFRDYLFVNSMSYVVDPIPHFPSPVNFFNVSQDQLDFVNRCYRIVLNTYFGSDYFTDSLVQPYDMKVSSQLDDSPTGSNRVLAVKPATPGQTTPVVENAAGTNTAYVDEYILSMLKAVSSKSQINALTKNNMLASALQQFGYKPESSDMIPYLLDRINGEIVVEPIVAQAEGTNVPFGYKAGEGKGSSYGKSNFEFDDYGILLCVNSISPDYFYTDGVHRELLHIYSEDYFDPAYVDLGFQPVAKCELSLLPSSLSVNDPSKYVGENTFGFQNKYAEYGYRRDFIGGDFCINSLNVGLDAYHFNRNMDFIPYVQQDNDEQFAVASWATAQGNMKTQFDRIFALSLGLDNIQQWTYFKILAHRSIPANGEYTVGTDDDNVVEGVGLTDNINN